MGCEDECYSICQDISRKYFEGEELSEKEKENYFFLRGLYYIKKFSNLVYDGGESRDSKLAQRYYRKSGWLADWIPSDKTLEAMIDVQLDRNMMGPVDTVEDLFRELER